jgi:peptidoglycan/LPS O-acetylase OafA/YrhL
MQCDTQTLQTTRLNYRPDIDGLRAIAVVMVMLFHAGLGFEGGYVGVDVFFVISGFLITRLIQKELSSDKFSLQRFWERRIRRIVPAAYACVAVTLVFGLLILMPSDLEDLGNSLIMQQLMLSNVYFWRTGDYFGGPAELKPLLHTWSLTVEEQFYLVYPIILVLLYRFGKTCFFTAISILAVGSLCLSIWWVSSHNEFTFFMLPTRAWEMLLGGMIANLPSFSRLSKRNLDLLGLAGLLAILFASIHFTSATEFPGAAALVPCVGTCLAVRPSRLY